MSVQQIGTPSFLLFEMKRVPPPRRELVEAMRAVNVALDRAEQLKNELEAFEIELSNFRFLRIETAERPQGNPGIREVDASEVRTLDHGDRCFIPRPTGGPAFSSYR